MDPVLRAATIYLALLVVFRISGQRSLSQVTTFDFVLLLIIAETTQQALLGDDFSVTNSILLIVSLIGLDIVFAWLKQRSAWVSRVTEGEPLIILRDGRPFQDRMDKERIDVSDILAAAREAHGLERLDQIKYAVLERSGGISIVPVR